jgi:hypothetical protein
MSPLSWRLSERRLRFGHCCHLLPTSVGKSSMCSLGHNGERSLGATESAQTFTLARSVLACTSCNWRTIPAGMPQVQAEGKTHRASSSTCRTGRRRRPRLSYRPSCPARWWRWCGRRRAQF